MKGTCRKDHGVGAGGDVPAGVPWDRQLCWGSLNILYCLCFVWWVIAHPSGGAGGAHGAPGQARQRVPQ